ncbi:unnamed protein product [Leuciscus chuanchicus]
MPKEPPPKKLKQRDILSFFQQSPEKRTARDSESGETSQASANVQKKQTARDDQSGETSHNAQERMGAITSETGRVIKEEKPSKSDHALQLETMAPSLEIKEGPSKHLQQGAEKQNHSFQFYFSSEMEQFCVVCDMSMTVLDALNTSDTFRTNKNTRKWKLLLSMMDDSLIKYSRNTVSSLWSLRVEQRRVNNQVFDEQCKLIGLHTGGYVSGERGRTRNIIEYAYPMQPILDMIRAQTRIRGRNEIVNILEAYNQQNQGDSEMEVD